MPVTLSSCKTKASAAALPLSVTRSEPPEGLPPLDSWMLELEHEIAEPKHQRRAYDELLDAWRDALAAGGCNADPARIEALFVAAWGGRRYRLLVQPAMSAETWVEQMQHICSAALQTKP